MADQVNKTGRRTAVRVDARAEPTSRPPAPRMDVVGPAAMHAGVATDEESTGERPIPHQATLESSKGVRQSSKDALETPRAPGDTAKRAAVVARIAIEGSPTSEPASPAPAVTPARAAISAVDPRYARLEPLLASSDWDGIRVMLGPIEDAGALPPAMGLLLAVAYKELVRGPAAQREDCPENAVAIRCAARLMGVPDDSAAALVFAKRLLRRNIVPLRARPAPRWKNSVAIMLLGIALGALVGYSLVFGPLAASWGRADSPQRAVPRSVRTP